MIQDSDDILDDDDVPLSTSSSLSSGKFSDKDVTVIDVNDIKMSDSMSFMNSDSLKYDDEEDDNDEDIGEDDIEILNQSLDDLEEAEVITGDYDMINEEIIECGDIEDEDDDKDDNVEQEDEQDELVDDEDEYEDGDIDEDEDDEDNDNADGEQEIPTKTKSKIANKTKKTKDDDDAWLEALEEGRLHEVDEELKKITDPKLMTTRQRALQESKNLKKKQEALRIEELNNIKKLKVEQQKQIDEEVIKTRLLKANRRKQQAEEKKEKDKKQTIDRLLKKKQRDDKGDQVKPGSNSARGKKKKADVPKISYINSQNGIFISIPDSLVAELELFPMASKLRAANMTLLPERQPCAVDGCNNQKRYSCSKTHQPCCSLACYRILNSIV